MKYKINCVFVMVRDHELFSYDGRVLPVKMEIRERKERKELVHLEELDLL